MSLTDSAFWDEHWRSLRLPVEVREQGATPYRRAILDVLRQWLPEGKPTVLEVGGAPGGYLAWIARTFGCEVAGLDVSPVGCEKLRENFRLLGLPVTVYQRDMLKDDLSDLPRFDVVYSLGLIEHFPDPGPLVARHLEVVKPGGLLILGVPNLTGLNWPFIRLLRPGHLEWHELSVMHLASWERFERDLPMRTEFKGYVGGWEPRLYIEPTPGRARRVVNRALGLAGRAVDLVDRKRRLNSRLWSGYAMAVYRKAEDAPPRPSLGVPQAPEPLRRA